MKTKSLAYNIQNTSTDIICSIIDAKNNNIYYNDKEYGKVRILAAYTGEFPCGTIIEVNNSEKDGLIGVVLDTGGGMIDAYRIGWTLIDLAYESESKIEVGINKNTSFSSLLV